MSFDFAPLIADMSEWDLVLCEDAGPIAIIENFNRGCMGTITMNLPPEACPACLEAHMETLKEQGFDMEECVRLLIGTRLVRLNKYENKDKP